jgi:hypothetical protein
MPQVIKYNRVLSKFAVISDFLTQEEVDAVTSLEKKLMFSKDQINGKNKADIAILPPNQDTQWLFDKFSALVGRINIDFFMYDIDGFDAFAYTKYKKGQECGWHYDVDFAFLNWERKISASIMLTDPEEYLGGEIEIMGTGDPGEVMPIKPNLGSIVFHAPWMPSRITTVTSGTRKSLNVWVMGKRGC